MTLLLLCLALQDPPLSAAETALLELPFKEGVFDPSANKCRRVRGRVSVRTCWGKKEIVDAPGWLVPAAEGRPARLVLNNLQVVTAPEQLKPSSFPEFTGEQSRYTCFADLAWGKYMGAQNFIWAGWLHRWGRDDEAAKLLRGLKRDGLVERFREGYGWELFNAAINAYLVGDDEDALSALESLGRFESSTAEQAAALLADLRRRKEAGTFGKTAGPLPADIASWPADKKIDRLIEMLDQLDSGRLFSGNMDLDEQPAARALLACGEAAVPALLRCSETDLRLTRSIGIWRQEYEGRHVLTVRAAALRILGAILRTHQWDPEKKLLALNFGEEKDDLERLKSWSATLRRYWDENRNIPFPERMARVLRTPSSTPEAQFEAAENLARLDRVPSLRRFRGWLPADDPLVHDLRPELAAYRDPTIAEAILAAMDRHVAAEDRKAPGGNWGELLERKYIPFFGELGDRGIVPALLKRHAESRHPIARFLLAFALRRLGEAGPLDALAREVQESKSMPPEAEASEIMEVLGRGSTERCELALSAVARRGHPWHGFVRERALDWSELYLPGPWRGHPYCLKMLRDILEERDPTREQLRFDPALFHPPLPKDPAMLKEQAVERLCDRAGVQLSVMIPDSPPFHPLLKDADARLKELRDYMDRHQGKFRRMTAVEMSERGLPWFRIYYIVGP